MEENSVAAVCDAGPLIHLSEIGQADLLSQFTPLLVPELVRQEAISFIQPADLSIKVVPVSDADREGTSGLILAKIDAGELDCLALCLRDKHLLFLTDDLMARKEASRLGVPVHGSVGIIVRAFRAGPLTLPQADEALGALGECRSLFISKTIMELGREQLRCGGVI